MAGSTETHHGAVAVPVADADPTADWRGQFESFAVGEPGRAASLVVPVPDPDGWDRRDTVLDGVALLDGAKKRVAEVRAASVRGLSHRAYGTVRQDEYGFRRTSDGRHLVIGVADGVSSGKHSHRAALIAARKGVEMLARALRSTGPETFPWADFVRAVANRIERSGRDRLITKGVADAEGMSVREVAEHLATTVLYAVVDLVPVNGAHDVHVVSVGDTSAWVLRAGGRWEPLEAVKNDGAELHSSSVQALPMVPGTAPVPVRTTVAPGEALVVMTDGIGDPLGHGTGAVGRFLTDVWSTPPASGLEFAAHVGFSRKSFDDDRTAVAFWPVARA
ncbi:protein phosphatase 2C domain-containing protein [Umezawaea tangerina]|uniref:Protein phosphatase 2C-like protein n=1 Tax=Umezawaea tangerina TaxID=84725 RepID=A0A2T0SLH2_9PSEU|nr:protein phosphatase 2C domain-containing protein [Umezawaea tangerina]PRY34260.1 protein phosphatase 2C-like protein [Umezawaea tangerina]